MSLNLQSSIKKYLGSIPVAPKIISEAIELIKQNEFTQASKLIEQDPALKAYILLKAASPLLGLKDSPSSIQHALSLFGSAISLAMLESYLLSQLAPKKWKIFKYSNEQYFNLQTSITSKWNKILESLKLKPDDFITSASLLVTAIAICDAIFDEYAQDTNLLLEQGLNYNDILKRFGGTSLYGVAAHIGKLLGFCAKTVELVKIAEDLPKDYQSAGFLKLAKLLHLLFFYELSQSDAIEAGLFDFANCNADSASSEVELFTNLIGLNSED